MPEDLCLGMKYYLATGIKVFLLDCFIRVLCVYRSFAVFVAIHSMLALCLMLLATYYA